MTISIAWDHKSPRWLTFATSWNYILVLLYFVYAFFISVFLPSKDEPSVSMSALQSGNSMDIEDSRRIGDNLPISVKIFWIFFNIALTLCTSVVVIYWVLLHDYNTTLKADLDTYLNFDRHGVNLVLLIIDFCLHHIPLRFLHFVYPLLVSLVYLIFNVVYWAITEELIYSAIDWENDLGMAIGYSIGNLVLIIIAQFIWYWINQGKRKIRRAQQEAHYVA